MTTYTINQLCHVNDNNPTPHRKDREIAINIVPVEPNNTIENFVLAIDNYHQCCEDWRAESNIPDGVHFITRIDVDVPLPLPDDIGNYFGVKIHVLENDTEKEYYAYVSNYHNGYYYHTIYYSDNQLKIDVLEEEDML